MYPTRNQAEFNTLEAIQLNPMLGYRRSDARHRRPDTYARTPTLGCSVIGARASSTSLGQVPGKDEAEPSMF
ncbi:unnamed protein product [Cochlearia groenlandica]